VSAAGTAAEQHPVLLARKREPNMAGPGLFVNQPRMAARTSDCDESTAKMAQMGLSRLPCGAVQRWCRPNPHVRTRETQRPYDKTEIGRSFFKNPIDSFVGWDLYSATNGDADTVCGTPDLLPLELLWFVA
jgi:hypothetical protein